jgi:NAD(P)-dependent dehydrogenase (short-subunit alcohol dehydrogenase family)
MREALAPEGIEVCVICPGFVRPHNTDGDTDTVPFLIDEPRAATKILKGVDKNVGIIALQSQMRLTDRILSALPHWLRRLLPK